MFVTFVATLTLLPLVVAAPAPAAEPPGRYLLIVETSEAMRRRAEGTQKLLGELMVSGFNGQLRAGDTIGVWTFNDQLHTGVFPLQLWTPQAREKIAANLVGFLQAQRYEKAGKLAPVLPEMTGLIKDSEKITVLFITTGTDKIHGTPFDAEINRIYQLNLAAQEKARLPYITILRAAQGEFSGYTVSTPPWPVEYPKFPPPAATAKPMTTTTTAATDTEKEQQRLAALRRTLQGGTILSVSATSGVSPVTTETVVAHEPASSGLPPATPPAAVNSDTHASTPASPAPFTNVVVSVTPPVPVVTAPHPAIFNVVAETNAAPLPKPEPVEPVVAAPPVSPPPPAVAPPPPVTPPPAAIPAPTGEESPPPPAVPRWVILFAGSALVLVALALLIVVLRRPTRRPPERISLITRSLDKDKN